MNPFDPMPTIKAILGMTVAQDIEQSILLAELDDFEAPQCESEFHDTRPDKHSGAAGFLMHTPCGHSDGYRCTHWIKYALALRVLLCTSCDLEYSPQDLTVIPIGAQK